MVELALNIVAFVVIAYAVVWILIVGFAVIANLLDW